ncbi:pirin family protein [Bradyrhizobium prioriisuperbiae]|uniref:pirin family protein n=1 Tax=Bradyrhizobium prioriisuperbiae TaxID=2854389 RepID=UPI0028E21AE6|nr:pirin family protein [Bradyrhizobium prioritasuperba]
MSSISKVEVDQVILPRIHNLGAGFEVRRALPSAQRQMVGPFIFFDAFGPTVFGPGEGVDTRPHPHIGLATLTYLIEGEIVHRDSAGHIQTIGAGEANWMTAGRGIVHSERTGPPLRATGSSLFGQQVWIALPRSNEEAEPGFSHHAVAALPRFEGDGASVTLIAGTAFGRRSPVATFSDMQYADVVLSAGARFQVKAEHVERAIYVVSGQVEAVGQDGQFSAAQLIVFKPGAEVVLRAIGAARVMLLGGEPLPEKRHIYWNFVSSSSERIEQAVSDWRERRFPGVPGETEYIPLPGEA